LENEVKERKPQINDAILTILSSKGIDDISDNTGREKLKDEIKKAVDSLLGYGKIERVYFTTFIMQ
jgi:flagellar FliL protein